MFVVGSFFVLKEKEKVMRRKQFIWIAIIIILIIFGGGLWYITNQKSTSKDTIVIGTQNTDTAVWEHIAKSSQAKKAGLNIKVKDITDSNSINKATATGQIDVNGFQSYAFFTTYNNKNPKNKLVAIGTTYIQPMGLYSEKYKKISEIPDGSTVVIANDAAAESRGLKLLESAGLITLKKHNANTLVTPSDIVNNPKKLQIKTVVSTSTPSVLHDNSVAAVAIDNNTAQQAKLNVLKDSIYHENINQNTKANVNVIVTTANNAKKSEYKKLLTLYHNKEIQKWIKKHYSAKVEVKKTLNYLKN